ITDARNKLFRLFWITAQQIAHRSQHALGFAMGANADLKPPRPEPGLIERPPLTDFTKHLRFVHAAVFKYQFARFRAGDRRNAARDAITRRAGVDQKTSDPF